ncbi:MAG: type II toxin-antitoxin system PemK/MazF family toxin [Rhodoglobus sp.]
MERGEIVLVSLDPAVGSEQGKTRPAVVVSSNAANDSAARRGRGVVTVVPLTGNVTAIYPFQVLLRSRVSGLAVDSKAQAEQVRSVASERVVRALGRLDAKTMRELDDALRLHLSL